MSASPLTSDVSLQGNEPTSRVTGFTAANASLSAAYSAAKIKNTEPGPLAITGTITSPMPYPPIRTFNGKGDANDEEQRR